MEEPRSFHCFDSSRIEMVLSEEEEVMFSEEEEGNKMNDDDTRDWAGLPVELLEKIHSLLLYGHDYDGPTRFRFHLTCKSWQSIRMNHRQHQHPVLFSIPTHSIKSAQRFQQIPLLISTFTWKGNDAGTCKLLHPAYMETYVIDYPEIAGASIVHSKYGWLLMQRERNLFFFNPFTRTTIDIIPTFRGLNISFTAPPTSPDCMLFSYANSVLMYCFRLGQDETWRHYQINYEDKMKDTSALAFPMCSPVFYNGGFYWFDINGKLGFFNPEEEGNNCYKKVVGPYISDISGHMNYIAEYDGELYTITVGKHGSFVRVFKLDCSGAKVLSSVELKSLGNKTIYISDIGTLLVPAKVEGTENKIFFPRFVDKECIYYCLRTCRYHFFGCSSSRGDWTDTKVINHCAWIEPDVNDAECGGEEKEETTLSLYNIGRWMTNWRLLFVCLGFFIFVSIYIIT